MVTVSNPTTIFCIICITYDLFKIHSNPKIKAKNRYYKNKEGSENNFLLIEFIQTGWPLGKQKILWVHISVKILNCFHKYIITVFSCVS